LKDVKEFLKKDRMRAHYWYKKSKDWSREQNLSD
jgi:hypothetical protein